MSNKIKNKKGDEVEPIQQMRVAYVPYHANGNLSHEDVELGFVSSSNDNNVFVKFDKQLKISSWDQVTSKSCYPDTLISLE